MTNLEAYQKYGTMDLFKNDDKYYFFDSIDETNEFLYISSVDEEEFFRVHFDSRFYSDETKNSTRSKVNQYLNNVSFQTR